MAVKDGYQYTYQNIGFAQNYDTQFGHQQVYENIGFVPPVGNPAGYQQVYLNGGFAFGTAFNGFEYVWEGDVNTLTPTPHIWFVTPTFGKPGDGITIVGHGMGTSAATYQGAVDMLFPGNNWVAQNITNWTNVAATANSYNASRKIDPTTPLINVEHVEISITIPSNAVPPGHQVRFRTDGP